MTRGILSSQVSPPPVTNLKNQSDHQRWIASLDMPSQETPTEWWKLILEMLLQVNLLAWNQSEFNHGLAHWSLASEMNSCSPNTPELSQRSKNTAPVITTRHHQLKVILHGNQS